MAKRPPSLTPRQRALARVLLAHVAINDDNRSPGCTVRGMRWLKTELARLVTPHRPLPWRDSEVAAHFAVSVADLRRILSLID